MDHITIQHATDTSAPVATLLQQWCQATLERVQRHGEITIRIISIEEMTQFNVQYRHKTGPTNVLSFPASLPPGIDYPLLGDILICAEIVNQEAQVQQKLPAAHWAHMVVHGTLHLLGYDHILDAEAQIMEQQEIDILKELGFTNPYETEAENNV